RRGEIPSPQSTVWRNSWPKQKHPFRTATIWPPGKRSSASTRPPKTSKPPFACTAPPTGGHHDRCHHERICSEPPAGPLNSWQVLLPIVAFPLCVVFPLVVSLIG